MALSQHMGGEFLLGVEASGKWRDKNGRVLDAKSLRAMLRGLSAAQKKAGLMIYGHPEATFAAMVRAAAVDHDAAEFRRIVESAGMLRPDAPVDTDEVGEYFSLFYDTVRHDAEMTWTREYANTIVRHTFDRTSPISQYATVPRAFVFIQRINLGLYALLGELGATGNYRRIASELWPFVDADPATELGRFEADWMRRRGSGG